MANDKISPRENPFCPNGKCEHGVVLHDFYDLDDTQPTCCVDGCDCPNG